MLEHKPDSRNISRSILLLFIIILDLVGLVGNVNGNNAYVSSTTGDLVSHNSVYMASRSYANTMSTQTLYSHGEATTVGGVTYYLLKLGSADASPETFSADAGTTTGRKLMGKFVYSLAGVSYIPTSVWTIYYRARKGNVQVEAHCDVDILIRTSIGAVRTTIATDVANSSALTTSWSTLLGNYYWAAYTVVDQTDYLEIDYYIEITKTQANSVYLLIDDDTLAVADQTRAANIMFQSGPQPDALTQLSTTLLFVLPFVFGLLFLLALKFKRKKTIVSPKPIPPPEDSLGESKPKKSHITRKKDVFSGQFGMTHRQMVGKKMLLEIDSASDYHRSLLNFVFEAKNNNESLFIFTNKNSRLHSALSGDENVNFRLLTSRTSSPQQINDKETLLPASDLSVLLNAFDKIQGEDEKPKNMVFDDLSDIILRCGFEKTYKFMRLLFETISSPKATALFVFNPKAHDQTILSSIRGLFEKQLSYPKSGSTGEIS